MCKRFNNIGAYDLKTLNQNYDCYKKYLGQNKDREYCYTKTRLLNETGKESYYY